VLFYTFVAAEQWSWIDSLYFTLVTMTTIGYGDVVPSFAISRLFASIVMVVGVILIAREASDIMEYLLQKNMKI